MKELKPSLRRSLCVFGASPDNRSTDDENALFKLTGRTGSRRYMAPEVVSLMSSFVVECQIEFLSLQLPRVILAHHRHCANRTISRLMSIALEFFYMKLSL